MEGIWAFVVVAALALAAGFLLRGFLPRRAGEPAVEEAGVGVSKDTRQLLRALRSTALVLDPSGEVLMASPSAYSYGFVRSGAVVSGPVKDLVAEARAAGRPRERELTVPRGPLAGAGQMIFEMRVVPLSDGRVLVVADDRTAARRLDQVRRDFVANVSHELKTPVGALALLSETLADAADDPEAVRRFTGQMKRESRRLTALVQEIIDLSRLQEPDALVDSELVALDDVAAEAADRVRVEAEARRITVAVGGERGLYVHGDADLLTTAVRNLLDNALRHSDTLGRVSVGIARDGDKVRLAVVDQGEGISPEQQERIFERFYRGDPARARRTGGTGLGLSIVKHVAADHGGEVEVWSKPGAGSTFTLVLPLADPPTPPDTTGATTEP
ncbi:cell wall metabolism sensor histidine kinase WalK [Georgenia sp. 311]|uniref:sensor histidine kinase n=1 Tax=Georgenia sp. 311 TaxID=2585134 RepID=UPI002100597F|nr:ATP-binding protein [Georgenia sp. 311]